MSQPSRHPPKSGFMSFLDWLGNTQQMGLNAARGDFGAVGRHALDFLSGPLRALVPGDHSDLEMSRPEDDTSLSEITGVDREAHPLLAAATDFAGLAFDPLTYIGLPEVSIAKNAARVAKAGEALAEGAKAAGGGVRVGIPFTGISKTLAEGADFNPLSNLGKGINKAASYLPDAAKQKYDALKQGAKETLGYLNPTDEAADLTKKAEASKGVVSKAAADRVTADLKGVSPEAMTDATHLVNNVVPGEEGYAAITKGATSAFSTREGQQALIRARLKELPWDEARKAKAEAAATKLTDFYRTMWVQGTKDVPIFHKPSMYQSAAGELIPKAHLEEQFKALQASGADVPKDFDAFLQKTGHALTELDPEVHAPTDYMPRSYAGKAEITDAEVASDPNMLHRRKVGTGADLADYLNKSGATLDTDALKSALQYGSRMGGLAEKTTIAKGLMGDAFEHLSHPKTRAAVTTIIDNLKQADPDTYRVLQTGYNGLEARGPVMDAIAKANQFFKKAAVAGILMPKVSTIMRNVIAMPQMVAVTPEAGGVAAAGRQVLRSPQTLWNGIREGVHQAFGLKNLPTDEVGRGFDLIGQAFQQAGGRAAKVAEFLRSQGETGKLLASAVENGVVGGGFLSTDGIYKAMTGSSWGQRALKAIGVAPGKASRIAEKTANLMDAPSAVFQGTEQYARLANYLDLVKRGRAPADAAKAVASAFYDYKTMSTKARNLRDLIPFAAFQTNAIRQSAKAVARTPAIAAAMNNVENQPDQGPVYPYLQDQLRIPIGKDQEGNGQYIAGLSLPIESLNTIPTSARDVKRDIIGSSAPVVKSLYGKITGEDPFFETPFGSYDRPPIPLQPLLGEHSKAGALYNELAGTGLIQTLDTPLRQIDKILDPRHDALTKAADLLTGANVVSVDPARARQQQLQNALKDDPNVQQYHGFLNRSKDPQTQALLDAYNQAKGDVKAKRKAAATTTPGIDPGSL